MPKPGNERAVADRATNLGQQIGALSRPSHLLGFVHPPVDQEVRCAFGNRRSDPLTSPESFAIVDQPRTLASEYPSDNIVCNFKYYTASNLRTMVRALARLPTPELAWSQGHATMVSKLDAV